MIPCVSLFNRINLVLFFDMFIKSQPTATISVIYDLKYYKAAMVELEEYLLSSLRDWPLLISPPATSPPYPRLSPGALLLCRRRLHPSRLDADQIAVLTDLDRQKEILFEHWLSAWQAKTSLDFNINLTLWQNYLQEGQDQGAYYHAEVRQRVILDLLQEEMPSKPAPLQVNLSALDSRLKRAFISGAFVWQDDLQAAFPLERFWYLYGQIRVTV